MTQSSRTTTWWPVSNRSPMRRPVVQDGAAAQPRAGPEGEASRDRPRRRVAEGHALVDAVRARIGDPGRRRSRDRPPRDDPVDLGGDPVHRRLAHAREDRQRQDLRRGRLRHLEPRRASATRTAPAGGRESGSGRRSRYRGPPAAAGPVAVAAPGRRRGGRHPVAARQLGDHGRALRVEQVPVGGRDRRALSAFHAGRSGSFAVRTRPAARPAGCWSRPRSWSWCEPAARPWSRSDRTASARCGVGGHHRAGVAEGAEVLARVEAEAPRGAERPGGSAPPRGAVGLGRVLDEERGRAAPPRPRSAVMSGIWPYRWTTTTARVRGVTAASTRRPA